MSKFLAAKKFFENKWPTDGLYDAEIEYLESTGLELINTNHSPSLNTKMEFELMPLEYTGASYIGFTPSLMGGNDQRDFRFFMTHDGIYFDYGACRIKYYHEPDNYSWYTIVCWNYGITINGGLTFKGGINPITLYNCPIYAFGDPSATVAMRLKYLKIYENNVLIQDLIPVRKGNIGYMYDKVSGQLFENQGSGNFILGQDIGYPEYPEYPDIAIAQNEYVTKYSLNRNFEKLVHNDELLADILNEDIQIETYNKNKTYDAGKIVFYKIQKTDPTLYVLSSLVGPNMHKPLVRKDYTTGKLYAINGDYWAVVGALDEATKGSETAKDYADTYISNSKHRFITQHQDNTDLYAHPTGKLGMKDSSILFRTFENINDDRQHFHYPYELRSYIADNAIYSGYMRKWDNGILEYDLIFKLSHAGIANDGTELLSANNYRANHQDSNFIYFQNDSDYNIFNQGGEYYVNINGTKQVNLNKTINAYSAKLNFIEPFKDTNYMVFTSNVKNAETEAFNTKNEVIESYDDRLVIDGLTIAGTADNAQFRMPLTIPNEIVNIKSTSLAYMSQVNSYPVVINIDQNSSKLTNIDNEAFIQSEMVTMSFPYSLRYIGKNAFVNCSYLTSLVFYVEQDPKLQPRIDLDAFASSNITEISVIYRPTLRASFKSSTEYTPDDQYDDMFLSDELFHRKFDNPNYLNSIGITTSPKIYVENVPIQQTLRKSIKLMSAQLNADDTINNEQQTISSNVNTDNNIITIDVNEFLAELSALKSQNMMRGMSFKANVPVEPTIQNVFQVENGVITGFDDSLILSNGISFNLEDNSDISAIGDSALDGFSKLVSLSVGSNIKSIAPNAFGYAFNELVLSASKNFDLSDSTFTNLCICNFDHTLTVDTAENVYYCGNSDKVKSNALSTFGQINNLYVNNVSTIDTNAFTDIESIQNVYINSNNSSTTLCACIFKTELILEDGDSWYEINADTITLIGNSFQVEQSAFTGIEQDYLSIDLGSSYINAKAFLSGDIGTLEIVNLDEAQSNTTNNKTYKGLYANSLQACYIANLTFPDVPADVSSLVSTNSRYLPQRLSATSLMYPCIVTTNTDSMIYSDINTVLSVPSCLSISNDFKILSCINSKIIDGSVYVPNTISAIAANAFENCTSAEYIYIPQSMKNIGNNAFKGCKNLETIIFEPGVQLTSIGEKIFSECSALESIHIPA